MPRLPRSTWEYDGRFEIFIRGQHKLFLTRAARSSQDMQEDDGVENGQSSGRFYVMRLRARPLPPELLEGYTFTTKDGSMYTIIELYWGYKGWVNRHHVQHRAKTRSVAENCAFAVCCNASTSSIYT
jgi:hypothetical protein